MTNEQFNALVCAHADAWRQVGFAQSPGYDPDRDYYLQDARECSEKLIAAFKDKKPMDETSLAQCACGAPSGFRHLKSCPAATPHEAPDTSDEQRPDQWVQDGKVFP